MKPSSQGMVSREDWRGQTNILRYAFIGPPYGKSIAKRALPKERCRAYWFQIGAFNQRNPGRDGQIQYLAKVCVLGALRGIP